MDWKEQLRNKALTLLSEPRVSALLQDPRVTQGIVRVFKLRTQVEQQFGQGVRQIAKTLHLATAAEVQELRRAVSRLERQLEQERHEQAEIAADSRALS
jgi:polyhydroxyalkanoate synthesis regulator phasin